LQAKVLVSDKKVISVSDIKEFLLNDMCLKDVKNLVICSIGTFKMDESNVFKPGSNILICIRGVRGGRNSASTSCHSCSVCGSQSANRLTKLSQISDNHVLQQLNKLKINLDQSSYLCRKCYRNISKPVDTLNVVTKIVKRCCLNDFGIVCDGNRVSKSSFHTEDVISVLNLDVTDYDNVFAVLCKHHYNSVYKFKTVQACCSCAQKKSDSELRKFGFDFTGQEIDLLKHVAAKCFKKGINLTLHSNVCNKCYCTLRRAMLSDKDLSSIDKINFSLLNDIIKDNNERDLPDNPTAEDIEAESYKYCIRELTRTFVERRAILFSYI
jgi:hypothetical protein